ncbi:DUF1048 domain-containing protein [Miniphocaeibacter massiliensis]|uniref:DUF1048 domain-containing protein n=1 Tax=Miniphocaeibacter massiliensis TaxID=2041841 RepID=UPI000C1C5A59|nr:DUF1048 domain-containing protein [Miniphocaeibacter massiliensis]
MKYFDLVAENEEILIKLDKKYQSVADDINYYLKTNLKSQFRTEIIMNDILNMFFDYQKREYSVEEVIGADIKVFCDEVLENSKELSLKDKIFEFFYDISPIILMSIIFSFAGIKTNFTSILMYKVKVRLDIIGIYFLLFTMFLIGRFIYKKYGNPRMRKYKNLGLIFAILVILGLRIFFRSKNQIVSVNLWIVIFLAVLFILTYFISKKYINDEVEKHIIYKF